MRAPLAPSQHPADGAASLSTVQNDTLREMLVTELGVRTANLEQRRAALVAESPDDRSGLNRAMSALQLFTALLAKEEIEDALSRMEAGRYGTCLACGRPLPYARLEAFPQARACAACPTSATRADRSPGSRPGPAPRREHRPPAPGALVAAHSRVRAPTGEDT